MPRKQKKNPPAAAASTTVLDDDVYGDDDTNLPESNGQNINDEADIFGLLTQFSEMASKRDVDEILKALQKQSFQLRKNGNITEAKKLQNLIKESNREKRDTEGELSEMLGAEFVRKSAGIPEEERTDDGDQSPIYGHYEISKMKRMWCSGMNWNPDNPYCSPWLRCLAAGDYDKMMKIIDNTPQGDVKKLLEKRETLLNVSAIFHVVKGSSMMMKAKNKFDRSHTFCNHSKAPRHEDCLKKLIELGANVMARDFAGFTPLHYSVACGWHYVTYEIVKVLLENGADPNAKNRLGEIPLLQPIMMKQLEYIKLLLDYDTDPTIKDNSGCTCLNTSQYDQDINKLFNQARQRKIRKIREKASTEHGGVLACEVCEKPTKSRCTGCYIARYCSRECQLSHWKTHKKICKENKERFISVNLKVHDYVEGKSFLDHSVWGTDKNNTSAAPKKSFLVKVQVPRRIDLLEEDLTCKDPMLVYDKDKNIYGTIETSEPTYKTLFEVVQSKGIHGLKGYFLALLDKDGKLKINVKDIQLPANW